MKKWLTLKIGKILIWLNKVGILEDVLTAINKIGIKSNLVPGHEMRQLLEVVKMGDIVLVRAFGETSTLFIGNGHTHSALQCRIKKYIVDSTGEKGVNKRDILDIFQGSSRITVLRLKNWTADEIKQLMLRAEHYAAEKIEYDYGFASNKKEMYCSEFIYHCINDVKPHLLYLRERFGIRTITPEDLYKATRIFDRIFEYRVND